MLSSISVAPRGVCLPARRREMAVSRASLLPTSTSASEHARQDQTRGKTRRVCLAAGLPRRGAHCLALSVATCIKVNKHSDRGLPAAGTRAYRSENGGALLVRRTYWIFHVRTGLGPGYCAACLFNSTSSRMNQHQCESQACDRCLALWYAPSHT